MPLLGADETRTLVRQGKTAGRVGQFLPLAPTMSQVHQHRVRRGRRPRRRLRPRDHEIQGEIVENGRRQPGNLVHERIEQKRHQQWRLQAIPVRV